MDFTQMSNDELLERRQAIAEELDAPEADLDALEEEVRAINTELETRKANEAKRVELRAAVANGAGETTNPGDSTGDVIATAGELFHHFGDASLIPLDRRQRRVLAHATRVARLLTLKRGHLLRHVFRSERPTDPPAGHRVSLADAVNQDRPVH